MEKWNSSSEVEQEIRGRSAIVLFESLIQDLRFGLRMLIRKPSFSMVALVILGLGIGANTAMFSIVNAVLLKPLPYKDSDRLVVVWQSTNQHRDTGEWFNTYSEFEEWRQNSRSFEAVAALSWAVSPKALFWRNKTERISAIPASLDLFSMLGVPAMSGRTFQESDLQEGCAVVLSHTFWQNRLGAPPDLSGQNLSIDQAECRVVGIMPRDFSFYPTQTDLWMLITPDSKFVKDPWREVTGVFGRLRPGVTRGAAEAELEILERNIRPQAPADMTLPQNAVPVVLNMKSEFTWLAGRNLRAALLVLLGTVFTVLLIACVNVANLMLAQAADRRRELAIRASLGSGRARLVRQMLVESMLLAFTGAVVGSLLAFAAVQIFRAHSPVELPPGNPVTVDWQVLACALLLAVFSAMLFGLAPAWQSSGLDLNQALKEASQSVAAGRTAQRSRSLLVAAEVALSLILLAGAGLLIESLARLSATPLGFRTDHLLTARIDLPDKKYSDPGRQIEFFRNLTDQLEPMPGVEGVSLGSSFYLLGSNVLAVEGRPFSVDRLAYNVGSETISQNFLTLMGIPLLQGRPFDSHDRSDMLPVAIVNQALAEQYFPGENPIGRHIKLARPESSDPWLTIIGVAANVKTTTVFQEMGYIAPPAVYRAFSQQPATSMMIFVRTHGDPNAMLNPLQEKLLALDNEVTISDSKTMQQRLFEGQSEPRFRTILLSAFAILALLLAALGIYGLLMQTVIRRTREIGIRMALGATRRNVIENVLRQTFGTVLAGIGIGLAGSFFLGRFLAGLLYDVRPESPLILGAVSVLLLSVSIMASYLPAKRASQVDPLRALRSE